MKIMSDSEEPPVKVTKYDMNNQYLEGEVMEEGQEEWLSEDLLTDDDEYDHGTFQQLEQCQSINTSEDTPPSLDKSNKKDISTTQISQEDLNVTQESQESQQSQERSVSQCSEDSDATNASFVLDTSQIGMLNESSDVSVMNDTSNIEQKLENLENSRDATPDLPDDLDTFLIRKTKVITTKQISNSAEKEKENEKKKIDDDDGNDTDDLLRLLEEGSNSKNKNSKQKEAVSSSDDDDDDFFKGSQSKSIKAATNALIQKRIPTKAVPEDDDITDASSDEYETTKTPINLRTKSKQHNSNKQQQQKTAKTKLQNLNDNNKQQQQKTAKTKQQSSRDNNKPQQQKTAKSKQQNSGDNNEQQQQRPATRQIMNEMRKQHLDQMEKQQKLLNRYEPKMPFVMKEPLLQLQKIDIDIKKKETIQPKSENVAKGPVLRFVNKPNESQVKKPVLNMYPKKTAATPQAKQATPQAKQATPQAKQTSTPQAKQTAPLAKQTVPQAIKTVPQAKQTAPPAKQTAPQAKQTAPQAKQTAPPAIQTAPKAMLTAPQDIQKTAQQQNEKSTKVTERSDEIINEKEFMEEGGIDLNEQFFKNETPAKEEQKQRLMKPERMDEEIPSDAESCDDDEESLYDDLPSSESDTCEDWFTLDIRTERAADYLPLLGEKAYEILTEEKKRVTAKVEEKRQRLEELTNNGRLQAEQLKKATLALAELDAALGAA